MNEILLSKLKKLLNLSKSANEHEADLALQKATELATEAGIDLAIVAAREDKPEEKLEMTEETIQTGARLPVLQKYASWLLQAHFGVHIIYSGGRWGGRLVRILGDKKDVEFAKFVNEFVQDDMQRRWEYYRRANGLELKYKQTFMYNVWRGLDAKLTEAKKNTEQAKFAAVPTESRAAVESKYGLVLSTKKQAVEAFVNQRFPSLRSHRTSIRTHSNLTVAQDGYKIGQTMTINRPLC